MMDVNTADRLDQMQTAWKESEAPEGGGGLPPDGTYQARIQRFDLVESEYSGHLQLLTEMAVSAGEYEGRNASTWHDLEDPERLPYAKAHLKALGLDPDAIPLREILSHVGQALDAIVEIRIKTKRGTERSYTNVYVNKLLQPGTGGQSGIPGTAPTATTAKADGDDDIPF
jgi:hypothetical protein